MNAQADRNLRWAHMSEGMFSDVATHTENAYYAIINNYVVNSGACIQLQVQ